MNDGALNVLHLYSGNLYGGIERLLATYAEQRDRCPQMRPHFGLCFDTRLADELRAAGSPVHVLGNRSIKPALDHLASTAAAESGCCDSCDSMQ